MRVVLNGRGGGGRIRSTTVSIERSISGPSLAA
jgi:hypothetical protein